MVSKKNIFILATGGTIAGTAGDSSKTTGYKAGALGVNELVESVPALKDYANIFCEQISNIDSKDITDSIWLKLAERINEIFSQGKADGIVITHGTDTLEETAYFLNLVVKSSKPVILTGAMRPATALSADGPMNILNAVRVAASSLAVNKGVLVVMNEEIFSARSVSKTHTINIDAFKAPGLGPLGYVIDGAPEFYSSPARLHTVQTEFDLTGVKVLPYVKIIYGHANDDGLFVEAAVKAKAEGIIYAGTGNGSIHAEAEKALTRASAGGIVVVRSSRVGSGVVIPAEESYIKENFIDGDSLSPQKARILLQLALTKTKDLKEIQEFFKKY